MTPKLVNFCAHHGFVVDAACPPPDEYDCDPSHLVPRGCSNIQCSRCGHKVKNIRNVRFVEPPGKRDEASIAEMFDKEDPKNFVSVVRSAVYFCRCERHEEYSGSPPVGLSYSGAAQPLDDDDRWWLSSWRCGGHPLLLTPSTTFDDVLVDRDTVQRVAEDALRGWTPADTDPRERQRAMWLARLFYRVFHVEISNEILRIAIARSTDGDPMTRARTIHFLDETQSVVASWWALELLREKRELFAGVPDPLAFYPQDKTIEDSLWRSAGTLIHSKYGDFARQEALTGERATLALYQVLARNDSAWFLEHAPELARSSRDLEMLRGQALDWLPDARVQAAVRARIDHAIGAPR